MSAESPLISYIRKCLDHHDLDYAAILDHFTEIHYPKKHLLLSEGDVCSFEGYVLSGCLKTYFIDEDGQEIVLTFATEDWWVSDLVSFHDQVPSRFFIETIEDSRLLIISPENKELLLSRFPPLERMFRLMVQKHLASYQQRIYNNFALTAEQRYHLFTVRYPGLLLRIPLYLIASYLGITPEALSRIRSRKRS